MDTGTWPMRKLPLAVERSGTARDSRGAGEPINVRSTVRGYWARTLPLESKLKISTSGIGGGRRDAPL